MKTLYLLNDDKSMVLADHHGPKGSKIVAVWESDLPAPAITVCRLMNAAYREGYIRAKAEIRFALGVSE